MCISLLKSSCWLFKLFCCAVHWIFVKLPRKCLVIVSVVNIYLVFFFTVFFNRNAGSIKVVLEINISVFHCAPCSLF